MELTRENFSATLPQVLRDIAEADFCSFDCEFTGLAASQGRAQTSCDTPSVRYAHARHSASRFALLQIGLCTFRQTGGSSPLSRDARYEARPYTAYVFPCALPRELMCSSHVRASLIRFFR